MALNAARIELAELRGATIPDAAPPETPEIPRYSNPLKTIKLAQFVLSHGLDELERLAVIEQLVQAALDTGAMDLAKENLNIIQNAFPSGYSRVEKLRGMYLEVSGETDQAISVYRQVLQKDEANLAISQRMIAALLSNNQRTEAIEQLVKHVDIYMQDADAWSLLADLYIKEDMHHQAAFCYEELLILRHSTACMLRYADVLACIEKYEVALKFYCQVVDLCPERVHAWYGIRVACKLLLDEGDNRKSRHKRAGVLPVECTLTESYRALYELAKKQIVHIYTVEKSPCLAMVQKSLV